MRVTRFIAAAITLTATTPAFSQTGLTAPARVNGWRADIDTVVAVARRVHAGPLKPAHSTSFAEAAANLRQRLPTISDARAAVEIQRLLAMLGDGHSLVYLAPTRLVPFNMLPIEVYLFDDGLYVLGAEGSTQSLVESRIEKFGSLPVAEVLRRMEPFVSRQRDGEQEFREPVPCYDVVSGSNGRHT